MHIGLPLQYPSDFHQTWIFSTDKNKQISNFMKIRPVGADLFCADRQYTGRKTDMTKLEVVFAVLRRHLIRNEQNSETYTVTAINHEQSLLYEGVMISP